MLSDWKEKGEYLTHKNVLKQLFVVPLQILLKAGVCVLFTVEWDLLVFVLKQCTYLYKNTVKNLC